MIYVKRHLKNSSKRPPMILNHILFKITIDTWNFRIKLIDLLGLGYEMMIYG
jgi:hypothetical protein